MSPIFLFFLVDSGLGTTDNVHQLKLNIVKESITQAAQVLLVSKSDLLAFIFLLVKKKQKTKRNFLIKDK